MEEKFEFETKVHEEEYKNIDFSDYICLHFIAKDNKLLEKFKITHIVTCVKLSEPLHSDDEIETLIIPVDDRANENIMRYFPQAVEFIENARKNNGRVVVHCSAGVSRSSSFVICYLMYYRKMDFESCFEVVKHLKPNTNPNKSFRDQLKKWEFNSVQERLFDEYRKRRNKLVKKNGFCRKCKMKLFSEIVIHNKIVEREEGEEEGEGECCSVYVLEQLCTFEDGVENEELVVIACRKCGQRIGCFVAENEKCGCGGRITESLYKIEKSQILFTREK